MKVVKLMFLLSLLFLVVSFTPKTEEGLKPSLIEIDENISRMSILKSNTNSIKLQSGYVLLKSKEEVGLHDSKDYEEIIIVLEGEGKFVSDQAELHFKKGNIIYCPPKTRHNIINESPKELKYIYVATKISN